MLADLVWRRACASCRRTCRSAASVPCSPSPAGRRRDADDRWRHGRRPGRDARRGRRPDRGDRRRRVPVDVDAGGGWIVPGFIDVQINGAHGIDVTTQPHRIDELAAVLPRYGVTAFLPTVDHVPARRAARPRWRRGPSAAADRARCRSGCTSRARCWRRSARGAHPARAPRGAQPATWSTAGRPTPAWSWRRSPPSSPAPPTSSPRSRAAASSCRSGTPTAPPRSSRPGAPPGPGTSPTCSTRCARSATAIPGRSAPRSPTTTSSSG